MKTRENDLTERKARRVRTNTPFRIDGFVRIDSPNKRSIRAAMVPTSTGQEFVDVKLGLASRQTV